MTTRLELPFPPTVNTYWKPVIRKRKAILVTSERGKKYQTEVYACIVGQKLLKTFISSRDLVVTMHLIPPDKRQRDADNYSKALFDSLTKAGFWRDDSQVKKLTIELLKPEKPGRVRLWIDEMEE